MIDAAEANEKRRRATLVGADAVFLWDWGLKRGSVRALGGIAYAAPLLSTGLLIAFGAAKLTSTIAFAAVLVIGGGALAAGDRLRK